MPVKQYSFFELFAEEVPLKPNIVLVRDTTDLSDFKACSRFGFDIETFGDFKNDALVFYKGFIRLVQVALEDKVYVADLGGWGENNCSKYPAFFSLLEQKLRDPAVQVVGHNLKFDLGFMLHHFGFRATSCADTMLMSQVVWSGVAVEKAKKSESRKDRCKLSHALKGVGERLGIFDIDKTEQKADWGWEITNSKLNYAAYDAQVVLPIYDALQKIIEKLGNQYSIDARHWALPVFAEFEYYGYPLDKQHLEDSIDKYTAALNKAAAQWSAIFPGVVWSATSADIVEALNKKYNLNLESSAKDSLALIAKKIPAVKSLLIARGFNISLTYLQGLYDAAFANENGKARHPDNTPWYTIRSHYRQIAQGWRSTSSNPNLQNPAKPTKETKKEGLPPVKSVFAPPPGYKLIVADMSAAHARIATQMSQDPLLLQVYNDDFDNHLLVAVKMFETGGKKFTYEDISEARKSLKIKQKKGITPTPFEQEVERLRDRAKIGFYSFLNQAGAATMQTTFRGWGIDISEEECVQLRTILRETYPRLYKFILLLIAKANSKSYSFSRYLDRYGYPVSGSYGKIQGLTGGINWCLKKQSKFTDKIEVAFTDSISFHWLSSESDIISTAMGKIRLQLLDHPEYEAYICNMIHDEINVIAKEEYAETVAHLVGNAMKDEFKKWLKDIPCEEKDSDYSKFICNNWGEK